VAPLTQLGPSQATHSSQTPQRKAQWPRFESQTKHTGHPETHWPVERSHCSQASKMQAGIQAPVSSWHSSQRPQPPEHVPVAASHVSQELQIETHWPVAGSHVWQDPSHVVGEQAPVDGSHVSQAVHLEGYVHEPLNSHTPGPVWQRSAGGWQLLTQIEPWTGSQVGVAQLPQIVAVVLQEPPEQVPVSQQPAMTALPLQGVLAVQVAPQPPQLSGSLETSMQVPPQHAWPLGQGTGAVPQVLVATSQTACWQ
jgi:hypothetical protein